MRHVSACRSRQHTGSMIDFVFPGTDSRSIGAHFVDQRCTARSPWNRIRSKWNPKALTVCCPLRTSVISFSGERKGSARKVKAFFSENRGDEFTNRGCCPRRWSCFRIVPGKGGRDHHAGCLTFEPGDEVSSRHECDAWDVE